MRTTRRGRPDPNNASTNGGRIHQLNGPTRNNNDGYDGKKNMRRMSSSYLMMTVCGLLMIGSSFLLTRSRSSLSSMLTLQYGEKSKTYEISSQAKLILDFDKNYGADDDNVVTLGPHKATLLVEKPCKDPGLWLRLEGSALVTVVLEESRKGVWVGSFSMPLEGKYSLFGHWTGCFGTDPRERIHIENVIAEGFSSVSETTGKKTAEVKNNPIFPQSAWISGQKFSLSSSDSQPYIWDDISSRHTQKDFIRNDESILVRDGAVRTGTDGEAFFNEFSDLSNYELVCWVGSDSAKSLHESFLSLRDRLFGHQRPFKFHYYPMRSFSEPDEAWEDETKKRFRKCKHILVSVDEMKESLSQRDYVQQLTKFINHLQKAFPDSTFPIWIFSVMEPATTPTNCHGPYSLPRSSYHPCNAALKNLFDKSPFQSRVHFLDNTDITLPQLGENQKDVLPAIALRIYVLVGMQVRAWRAIGQKGTVKGLVRGHVTEPNFELVPYADWAK